jgi:flavodoxin
VQPSETQNYDLLMLGTPVEGASPTKEAIAFFDNMPTGEGKKVILFVTYRLFGNKRTMNSIDKRLAEKGYQTVLMVSKKSKKNENPPDYSEALTEIKKTIENL